MKRLTLVLLVQLMLVGVAPVTWGNEWVNRDGRLNPSGGWFEWIQNTVDGRHCALGYAGNLQCYDPATNALETVYVDGSKTPDPQNGDTQIFGWDHVNLEYLAMDGGRTIGPNPMAFSMVTRTWRILTNADFDGIESRTRTGSAGSATSPDHDLFVVFGDQGGYPGRKALIYDLRNRAYRELNGPASMPSRSLTQGQFLYIPSLRQFLLFGGSSSNYSRLNDLWLLDPATWVWTQVSAQNPPSGRVFSQMAYDRANDVVYLYGGHGALDGGVSVLHLSTWTWEHLPEPPGTVLVNYPGVRRAGAGIFDADAGFCSGSGVLVGTTWIGSAEIWCWTHSFDGPPPPPEIIVDNSDAATETTGTWSVSSGVNPWAGNSVFSNGGGTFRWLPNVPMTGTYEVFAWWTFHPNRSSNVPYRIRENSVVLKEVFVDQKNAALGGRWILLGTVTLSAGSVIHVEVSSENGQASADAVRLLRVDSPLPPSPGWVLTTTTPNRVRFEYRSAPQSGVDLYDCIVDSAVIDCQRR